MSLLVKELHAFFLADLILTVLTLEYFVGTFPEPFGIFDQSDLPPDQKYH
jgi:hypothetical protein